MHYDVKKIPRRLPPSTSLHLTLTPDACSAPHPRPKRPPPTPLPRGYTATAPTYAPPPFPHSSYNFFLLRPRYLPPFRTLPRSPRAIPRQNRANFLKTRAFSFQNRDVWHIFCLRKIFPEPAQQHNFRHSNKIKKQKIFHFFA